MRGYARFNTAVSVSCKERHGCRYLVISEETAHQRRYHCRHAVNAALRCRRLRQVSGSEGGTMAVLVLQSGLPGGRNSGSTDGCHLH